jgi:chromosome segregation ATPase
MNNRIGVVVLVLLAAGLGVALIMNGANAAKQKKDSANTIQRFSNDWTKASSDLEKQKQDIAALETNLDAQKKAFYKLTDDLTNQKNQAANALLDYSNKWASANFETEKQKFRASTLETNLDGQKKMFNDLTNRFTQVSISLIEARANLAKAESSLRASQTELAKSASRIKELEAQTKTLDSQALELSAAITNLTTRIADTQKKLATSEGDKAALGRDLDRMIAEKAELERRFNNLEEVRAQNARLSRELHIARRLEWARQGITARNDQRGAQLLLEGFSAPQ